MSKGSCLGITIFDRSAYLSGKIKLPFKYTFATTFYGKYAFVEFKEGEKKQTVFLNRDREVIKKLSADYDWKWYKKEARKYFVRFEDGTVYDYKGTVIEDYDHRYR